MSSEKSSMLNKYFDWRGQPRVCNDGDFEALCKLHPIMGKESKAMHKSDGVVGIEVECENFNAIPSTLWNNLPMLWANIPDNSLRNLGREFVSIPLRGQHIPGALRYLDLLFQHQEKEGLGKIVFSDLCSIHVHVNVRDFSVEQLANLQISYLPFENAMFRFAGPNRTRNIFCLPLGILNPLTRTFLSSIGTPQEADSMFQVVRDSMKYSAFNLRPIQKQGTVEFRHMEGNLDVDRICNWVSFILLLRDYAKNQTFGGLIQRVSLLNTNSQYEGFAREIFGSFSEALLKPSIHALGDSKVWNEVAEGVRKVKALSISARDIYVDDSQGKKKEAPAPGPFDQNAADGEVPPPGRRPAWRPNAFFGNVQGARILAERDVPVRAAPPRNSLRRLQDELIHEEERLANRRRDQQIIIDNPFSTPEAREEIARRVATQVERVQRARRRVGDAILRQEEERQLLQELARPAIVPQPAEIRRVDNNPPVANNEVRFQVRFDPAAVVAQEINANRVDAA